MQASSQVIFLFNRSMMKCDTKVSNNITSRKSEAFLRKKKLTIAMLMKITKKISYY